MKEKQVFFTILTVLFFTWLIGILIPSIPSTNAAVNQTVLTKVNVTNTEPRVHNVTVVPTSVTLNAGTTVNVTCNATVNDYNGVPVDITNVTADFFFNETNPGDAIKNDTHYLVYCRNVTTFSTTSALYSCDLNIWYFARNGTWICNVTGIDRGYVNTSAINITTFINPLIALNVTDVIDYGSVPVLNTSDEREANITNFGNTPINITVRGWGGQNESLYPNLSMICEFGNISIDLERYNTTSGQSWNNMINLTGTNTLIDGLRVPVITDAFKPVNKTYWKIKIPMGAGGMCNGTLLFTASNSQ